jgi:hypothetical protein
VAPNVWDMLRMRGKVYTRYENGEKEYYDLAVDPYQVHNAFGMSDTDYPPPDDTTRDYYGQRLSELQGCSGLGDGAGSCRVAENAPQLPASTIPWSLRASHR